MRGAVFAALFAAACSSGDGSAGAIVDPVDRPAAAKLDAGARADRGYVGVIAARESTDVSAVFEGTLTEVHVRIGDKVKAGDPIATIENRNVREQIAVAQAAVRSARAAVAQAQVEVDAAKETLDIEEEAFGKGTSSRRDLTAARFRHRKALAALGQARAGQAEESAQLEQLRRRLAGAVIKAPFAGTIALRHLDPGAALQPGTPIVRLITSSELWVKYAVPSADASSLAVGQTVGVSIEGLDTDASATIQQIAPEIEPNSQMIIVEAELTVDPSITDRVQSGLVVRVH